MRDLSIPLAGRVLSFSNWFWDGLQFFLPFNSRLLNVDRQKLCEKSALVQHPQFQRDKKKRATFN
jgi:hypothetical protein